MDDYIQAGHIIEKLAQNYIRKNPKVPFRLAVRIVLNEISRMMGRWDTRLDEEVKNG